MVVVSIIGTSGSGKSFLVKKLALLDNSLAFFEGEEKTIPKKIMKDVFNSKNPVERFEYFISKYKSNLKKAKEVSLKGKTCYVDGSPIIVEAVIGYEQKKFRKKLSGMLKEFDNLNPDVTLFITANKKTLKKFIELRNRKSEKIEETLERALFIQKQMIKIAKKKKNCIIIDRSKLDFNKKEDLDKIYRKIWNKKFIRLRVLHQQFLLN